MTTITHTAVGAAIGTLGLGAPASFLVGMGSHVPLDLVPHWDIKRTWIDTLCTSAALVALLIWTGSSPVFWGAAGGALPDLEHLLPLPRKLFPAHGRVHGRALGPRHFALQAALIALSAFAVVRIYR
jgi:hypothetical protein